jgi:hypothetical protein
MILPCDSSLVEIHTDNVPVPSWIWPRRSRRGWWHIQCLLLFSVDMQVIPFCGAMALDNEMMIITGQVPRSMSFPASS